MKLTSLRRGAFALALALLLSLWSPALAAEAGAAETGTAAETSALAQSAQTAAEAALQYGSADSVSYALWKDGEIVLTGSAGAYSRTEDRALTDDVLYGVGSISKTYTAVLMMTLVEAGKVDLDQPVTTYLPEFTMADPRYEDITVRMLLNHSSGLMGSAGPAPSSLGTGRTTPPTTCWSGCPPRPSRRTPGPTASTPTTATLWPSWSLRRPAAWTTARISMRP